MVMGLSALDEQEVYWILTPDGDVYPEELNVPLLSGYCLCDEAGELPPRGGTMPSVRRIHRFYAFGDGIVEELTPLVVCRAMAAAEMEDSRYRDGGSLASGPVATPTGAAVLPRGATAEEVVAEEVVGRAQVVGRDPSSERRRAFGETAPPTQLRPDGYWLDGEWYESEIHYLMARQALPRAKRARLAVQLNEDPPGVVTLLQSGGSAAASSQSTGGAHSAVDLPGDELSRSVNRRHLGEEALRQASRAAIQGATVAQLRAALVREGYEHPSWNRAPRRAIEDQLHELHLKSGSYFQCGDGEDFYNAANDGDEDELRARGSQEPAGDDLTGTERLEGCLAGELQEETAAAEERRRLRDERSGGPPRPPPER